MSGLQLSITENGATQDSICTQAIQQTIDAVADQGGGTVLIPDGRWTSGTIHLKSGVTLLVRPNAVLVGSGDIDDYPVDETRPLFQGQRHHFLVADGAENVTITGGGVIDGNGQAFWLDPEPGRDWYRAKKPRVSPMIELRNSKRLVLDSITVRNSPGWTIHPYCCDDVTIRNVRVENHLFGPNTDGIDINGCRDVFISDCKLITGDDSIIIKATKDARSTERVMVTNCTMTTNCIGVGIGQETESDVRQVTVSNCVMHHCHRMIAFGIWAGGLVEDVTVTGCVGDTHGSYHLARPIQLEVKQHVGWDVPLGQMRNIQISNILARTNGRVLLTAQEGTLLENVVLRDINLVIDKLEDAAELNPADGATGSSQYANRNIQARNQNAAVVVENMKNFVLDGLYIQWPEDAKIPAAALWARNVQGGLIDATLARPCGGAAEAMVLQNVDATIRR
ncbi:MAG: glycoside hydrolase family 28 protein [Phycisphaerae bacterium]